ncbi:MAG: ATP synthase F0 subunit B, partial [Desulfobacterales bacterium]|nr:ATP synthase F0 subunit B [Desulfobacterales bacterium]
MRLREKRYFFMITSLVSGILIYLLVDSSDVFAEGGPSPGRKLWDSVMLWVNFGILIFVFLKFARKPLMAYLGGVRKKIEENLNTVNEESRGAKSLLSSESDKLAGIDQQLKEIRESIIEIAKAEKESLIESGKMTGEKMIENARAYASHRLASAKKAVSDELVDMAISMAEEKLR